VQRRQLGAPMNVRRAEARLGTFLHLVLLCGSALGALIALRLLSWAWSALH